MSGEGPGGMPMAQWRKLQRREIAIAKLQQVLVPGSTIETECIFQGNGYTVLDMRPSPDKLLELNCDQVGFLNYVSDACGFRRDDKHKKQGILRSGIGVGVGPSQVATAADPARYVIEKLATVLHENKVSLRHLKK